MSEFAPPALCSSRRELAQRYLDLLLAARRGEATRLILGAIEAGDLTIRELYLDVFQPVLHEVGRRWQANQLSVAHEHFVSAATQMLMSQLYPRLLATPRRGRALVAACAGDELHEIGLRMVADLFELDGWDSYYLGARVPIDATLIAIRERRADVLALSATLPDHRHHLRATIEAIRGTPELAATRVLVGGAAFQTSDAWHETGADGFAADAASAVALANDLLDGARARTG